MIETTNPVMPEGAKEMIFFATLNRRFIIQTTADYANPALPTVLKNFLTARAAIVPVVISPAEEKLRADFEAKLSTEKEAAYAAFRAAELAK